jgi:hypothetical protein
MNEETVFKNHFPEGEYRDVLIGPHGKLLWEMPWQRNLIVEGLRRLLAALIKGDPQGNPVAFFAVGTGQEVWDDGTLPSKATQRTRTQLYNEAGRKAIPPGQITFLGGSFTNRLEINMEFITADIPPGTGNQNRRLREFGLFAAGTSALNSGILINHRIHSRIDMQEGFTLQRTLRLTF